MLAAKKDGLDKNDKYLDDPMDLYLRDVGQFSLLTEEEEREITSDMVRHREGYLKELYATKYFFDYIVSRRLSLNSELKLMKQNLEKMSIDLAKRSIADFHEAHTAKKRERLRSLIDLENEKRTKMVSNYSNGLLESSPDGIDVVRQEIYNTCYFKFFKDLEKRLLAVNPKFDFNAGLKQRDVRLIKLKKRDRQNVELELLCFFPDFLDAVERMTKNYDEWITQKRRLMEANLRLVISIAKEYNLKNISLIELISMGNIGLARAAEMFDPSKYFKFSTYATEWITQEITRAFNKERIVRFPQRYYQIAAQVREFQKTFFDRTGREASGEEVRSEFGLSKKELELLHRYTKKVGSIDAPRLFTNRDREVSLPDIIAEDSDDIDREMQLEDLRAVFEQKIFPKLTKAQRQIVEMKYGIGCDKVCYAPEIGKRLGVTREAVRQTLDKSLKRIEKLLRLNGITCLEEGDKKFDSVCRIVKSF